MSPNSPQSHFDNLNHLIDQQIQQHRDFLAQPKEKRNWPEFKKTFIESQKTIDIAWDKVMITLGTLSQEPDISNAINSNPHIQEGIHQLQQGFKNET